MDGWFATEDAQRDRQTDKKKGCGRSWGRTSMARWSWSCALFYSFQPSHIHCDSTAQIRSGRIDSLVFPASTLTRTVFPPPRLVGLVSASSPHTPFAEILYLPTFPHACTSAVLAVLCACSPFCFSLLRFSGLVVFAWLLACLLA
jgi:hypothetical protein